MKNLLILFSLLFAIQIAQAHRGGHGHAKKNSTERTWHYEDRSVAAFGSFLLVKENKVFIEQDHKVISIAVADLSWMDREFIDYKTKQVKKINANEEQLTKKDAKTHVASILGGLIFLVGLATLISFRSRKVKKSRVVVTSTLALVFVISIISCGSDDTITTIVEDLISATSNPEIINEAFALYSNVSTDWDDDYFYVNSDGIPDHEMMVGITAWIAQVPIPQPYTDDNAWSIPLNTEYAENPISIEDNFQRGAIGIAANGVPIFNPINASGLISNEIGELDPFGGHSGRGDDYHYHTAPLHLESTSGTKAIAYALDGYAVYGSTEPDGSAMLDLDEYHGHEYADGSYHYHGTDTYPYMIAAMRGEVTLEGDAPQNQVTPQPSAQPPRDGDPHGINSDNLIITELVEKSAGNGYVLSYTIGDVIGSVDYSWDENDLFTFIFNDVDGSITTETFQR